MGRYISNTNTNSYQDNELLLLKQGCAKNRKEFLSAGTDTWTIDHDVIVRVRVWGGGGGGGGGGSSVGNIRTSIGGGGGAGGAAEAILRLNAGTYNITVGAPGSGGHHSGGDTRSPTQPGPGGAGGSSSFHTYITCSGGLGGDCVGTLWSAPGSSGKGLGGTVSFNWSGFDGLLYVGHQFGGAGGYFETERYESWDPGKGASYTVFLRCGGGEGESGGPASYIPPYTDLGQELISANTGGGGGYNPPFIYGSGRGVGTGGDGGHWIGGGGTWAEGSDGLPGRTGAVVIEWN